MKGLARDYFSGGATRNTVLNLITQMSNATTAADRQAAAFSIMKQVAGARLTSATGTAAAGGSFVTYVLGCADLAGLADDKAALVLSSGIFEVRGGSKDDTYQALAFVKNTSGQKALASPRWGVEPTLAHDSWDTTTTVGSYLVFGYPYHADAEVGVGAPAAINTNEIGAPSYNAFELGTVPTGSEVNNKLRVGLCVNAFTTGSEEVNLFFHNDEIQTNTSPSFCTTSNVPGFASLSTNGWLTRLASAFAPKWLVAQDFDSKLGGLPSGWSPFHSGKLKGSSTNLHFTAPPTDGFVNVVNPNSPDVIIAVTVPSTDPDAPAGTKVAAPAGVQVTLSIAGNNGAPANFSANGQTGKSLTVFTNSSGIATFAKFSVSKAGGYLATVRGSLGGLTATLSETTTMFWIKNKTP
jgi:hypothetical protein